MVRIKMPEFIFVFVFSVALVGACFFQTYMYYAVKAPDREYLLVHNYQPDYFWYLSLIEQGREGNILLTSRYSTVSFAPQPVNTFFALLGIAGRITGLSNVHIYLVARIFFALGQILSLYMLIAYLFSKQIQRLFAFLITIGSFPFTFMQGKFLTLYGWDWSPFDPLVRYSYLPHHMAANMFLFVSMLFVFYGMEKKKSLSILLGFVIFAVSGLINPGILPVVCLMYFFGVLIHIRLWKYTLIPSLIGGLLVIGVILFLSAMQNTTFPWTAFRDVEREFHVWIGYTNFFQIVGVSGIIGSFGVGYLLVFGSTSWRFIALWALLQFISIWKLQFYAPFSNIRFIQSPFIMAYGLLSAKIVLELLEKVRASRLVAYFILGTVIGSYIFVGYFSVRASIDQQMRSVASDWGDYKHHPTHDIVLAIKYINEHAKPNDIAASPWWLSVMLPGMSPVRVFYGHPTLSYIPKDRTVDDLDIILHKYDQMDVRTSLLERNVRYIAYDDADIPTKYYEKAGYTVVFSSGNMRVFERSK